MDYKKHQKYLDILEDYAKRQGTTLETLFEKTEEIRCKEYIEDLRKRAIEYGYIR